MKLFHNFVAKSQQIHDPHRRIARLSAFALSAALCLAATGCTKAVRQARHIQRANRFFAAGEFAGAEIEYINALRLGPEDPLVIRRLGSIYYDQGRLKNAFIFLRRAKELSPDDLESRTKLASLLQSAGDQAKAREELAPVLAKEPANVEAVLSLAETATTPADFTPMREQLQSLRQRAGDKAVFYVAEGLLDLRQTNAPAAEKAFKQALTLDTNMATAYIGLGAVYRQRKDTNGAEKMYRTGRDLSPARSTLPLQWVDFKIKTGGAKEAKAFLDESLKKTSDYLPALNRLAELELADGTTGQCAAHIAKMLSLDPENSDARSLRGRLLLAEGQTAKAIQEFEALKALYPKQWQAHYQLALAYLRTNDVAKASASLEQALTLNTNLYEPALLLADLRIKQGRATEAIPLLLDVAKRQPNAEQPYYLLANAYHASGRLDDALNVYRGLAKASPKDTRALVMIGAILRQQNKQAEARKALEDALKIDPNAPGATTQLVDLDIVDKNYTGAVQRAQAGLDQNPKAFELRILQSKAYWAKGDVGQAEATLRKCLELNPDLREAYIILAQILVSEKRLDQALEELNKASSKNPNDGATLMLMAMLVEAKSDYPRARDAYEKLLAVEPRSGLALNNLAYLYAVHLKQVDKGLGLARQARQVLPTEPSTADTLGWITYLHGDFSAALPLLQEAAEKLLDHPEVQYHCGMAHYMMGNEAGARAALSLATKGDTAFVGKEEAKEKLALLTGNATGSGPELVQSLEKSLARNPNDLIALLRLAELYAQSGNLDKALSTAEAALKLNPKAVRAMLVLADVYGARPEGAQKAFDYAKQARLAAPEDAAVAHAAGRAAFQVKQYEWAYSILQESNRRNPGKPEVLYDLAWSAYSLGKVQEAEEAMRVALKSAPTFSRAKQAQDFLDFAHLAYDPVGSVGAADRIAQTLKSDPNYVPALMASAVARERAGQFDEARKLYDQVLSQLPLFLPATRNLAILYANRLDDPQKAYDIGTKARQAFPSDIELAKALGKAAYLRNEHRYAAQLLKEVQLQGAADAEAYFYLGMSQYRLKQKSDTTNSLNQALAKNLDEKLGGEARKVLVELNGGAAKN